jgi:multidrug resistance efflux pump
MSVIRTILGWIAPVAILGAAIFAFLVLGGPKSPPRRAKEALTAVSVRTASVEQHPEGLDLEVEGVVVPLREVTLGAEVAGRVLRKTEACNDGQMVTAGTLLFEIDPRDYELEVARLEKELSQASLAIEELEEEVAQNAASVELARRQVELARREATRLEGLKADKVVTESEHDRAVRDELAAANALSNLEGQKRVFAKRRTRLTEARSLAETMLEKANLDLSRTKITSPVTGIVVEDLIEQDSFIAKGAALVTIEDTSATEVKTSLRMDEVARVWGGRTVTDPTHGFPEVPAKVVFTFADRRYEWDGSLTRQEGRGLDEKTRTLPCRVRVPEPTKVRALDRYGAPLPALPPEAPRSLLRGMFVQVVLHVDVPQPLVSVPQEAMRPTGDLFVMRDGKLVIVRPRRFHAAAGRIVVDEAESGVVPGDRVVVSQIPTPVEGMELVESTQ